MTNTLSKTLDRLNNDSIKYGDIKKLAKEIKKDHNLGLELWKTGQYYPRLLAVLILDKKFIDNELMYKIAIDLIEHEEDEWKQILDWLYANQINKSKKTLGMVDGWIDSKSPILKKLFWTHQYRLRWTGKTGHENTEELIAVIESTIMDEITSIQESMIMTAGWIGVYNLEYRDRIISLGEDTKLFKDKKVSPGCTPWYLPDFISIEADKRGL